MVKVKLTKFDPFQLCAVGAHQQYPDSFLVLAVEMKEVLMNSYTPEGPSTTATASSAEPPITKASIFDSLMTSVNGKMVKVVSWYDNEAGYSARMADLADLLLNK